MFAVEEIKVKYPGADAWQMGDSAELASKLAELVKKASKQLPADRLPLTSRRSLLRRLGAITLFLMVRIPRSV